MFGCCFNLGWFYGYSWTASAWASLLGLYSMLPGSVGRPGVALTTDMRSRHRPEQVPGSYG